MKSDSTVGANKPVKKSYSKPELQVYGNLAELTNASTNRTGMVTDGGCHTGRTH
jgi:hypothetical protein